MQVHFKSNLTIIPISITFYCCVIIILTILIIIFVNKIIFKKSRTVVVIIKLQYYSRQNYLYYTSYTYRSLFNITKYRINVILIYPYIIKYYNIIIIITTHDVSS